MDNASKAWQLGIGLLVLSILGIVVLMNFMESGIMRDNILGFLSISGSIGLFILIYGIYAAPLTDEDFE